MRWGGMMLRRGGACSSRCKMSHFYVCCFFDNNFHCRKREEQGLACGLVAQKFAWQTWTLALSTQFTPKMPFRYPTPPYQIASNVVAFLINLRPYKLRYNEGKIPIFANNCLQKQRKPDDRGGLSGFFYVRFLCFFSLILRCFMFLFSLFQARIYGTKGGRAPLASVPILSSFLTPCGCVMRLNFGNLSVSLPTFYSKPREVLHKTPLCKGRGTIYGGRVVKVKNYSRCRVWLTTPSQPFRHTR